MTDETYMRRALELAEKGAGWVSPNPLVGAVIVKDEEIIGEGYHERYGQLHAERNALARQLLDGFPLETRTTGFFCWLKLPDPWAAVAFAEAARQRGIIVADSDLFALNHASPEQGVRLALGGVRTREALADALGTLAGMLHG